MRSDTAGVGSALAAFFLWGVLPVFWKQLSFLPPLTIVAQRTLWSLAILLCIVIWTGELRTIRETLRSPRGVAWHLAAGLLLAANWLLYVWATLNDRIVEGALGYYLNPFFNMWFGFLWFGERHKPRQRVAIGLALAGVLVQVPAVGHFPWVALTLALSFSLYAVVKKRAPLGSRAGLAIETGLIAPLALGWLVFGAGSMRAAFGADAGHAWLVACAGVATTLPLLFFGHAARSIRLSTLGILQFLGPTLQFLIGWRLYGEPMGTARVVSFSLIWIAVALYAADAVMEGRKRRR